MQYDSIIITLADDDEDDRLFFTDAFQELKINTIVNTVNNGRELLNFLNHPETVLPNIIFLDLNMPILNGIDCLKEIKRNDKFNDIAIAIYSTSSSDQDVENTFVLGANIYIKKPSNFNDLKKILSDVVTINWQYHTNDLNKENFLLRL
ncbi:Response regulator receiver domain-containing protein [Flavobacterium fluvii]|uniref:Response regulator receiver domain-containing protein n=1 Tax=Flavobacterium fluvii TaxID=468056 RepID=A0A1M5J9E8_9FLAO|nr:response regulator [Flavobacterium fluvii]SHG37204.1 Response regulator receiver domain-containing protein [Flavobacterium fluvii]